MIVHLARVNWWKWLIWDDVWRFKIIILLCSFYRFHFWISRMPHFVLDRMDNFVGLWFKGWRSMVVVSVHPRKYFFRHSYLNEIFGGYHMLCLHVVNILCLFIQSKLRRWYNLVPLEKFVHNECLNFWLVHIFKDIPLNSPPVWKIFLVITVFQRYLLTFFVPWRHKNLVRVLGIIVRFFFSVLIHILSYSVHLVNAKQAVALVSVHGWFHLLFGLLVD